MGIHGFTKHQKTPSNIKKYYFLLKNWYFFKYKRSFLRIWSHLLKKSLMENFVFCAVRPEFKLVNIWQGYLEYHEALPRAFSFPLIISLVNLNITARNTNLFAFTKETLNSKLLFLSIEDECNSRSNLRYIYYLFTICNILFYLTGFSIQKNYDPVVNKMGPRTLNAYCWRRLTQCNMYTCQPGFTFLKPTTETTEQCVKPV